MDRPVQDLLRRMDDLSDQFRELRDGVAKAVRIADQDPDMALTRARKVLELIVRDVYERRVQAPPGTQPLENLLQRLAKDGHIPRKVAAYAHAIRELGNVGTHAFGERVTAADVYQSLSQLLPVLEWYFEAERPEALGRRPEATPAPPAESPAAPPAATPRRRRPGPVALAAGACGLAALAGLVFLLTRPEPPGQEHTAPARAASPADPWQESYVERHGSRMTLDSALPLYNDDRLHFTCALPSGVEVALFWLDTEGKLEELTRAEVSAGRLDFPGGGRVVKLTGPPGTEFILAAGGRQGKPGKEEVRKLLGTTALPSLLAGVKDVRLGKDGVRAEVRRALGGEEPGAGGSVAERLEALRRGLRGRYEFVAGLALPHRVGP
jgi:hypothetical protein